MGLILLINVGRSHAVEDLKASDPSIRRLAVRQLQGDWENLAFLVAALHDPDPSVRAEAASVLTHVSPVIGYTPPLMFPMPTMSEVRIAVPALVIAMRDESPDVRRNAAEALGEIRLGAEMSVPALVRALQDPNFGVRKAAAISLGKMALEPDTKPHTIQAVPALIDRLGDDDLSTRYAAANTLGDIGPGAIQAVPALLDFLNRDPRHYEPGYRALRAIEPQAAAKIQKRE